MKNLVFVESPTKAATLAKFLGKNYQVEPTFGHVRDLPKGAFGVDVFNNFEPKFVIPKRVQKRVNQLIKIGKNFNKFYLATDPDREGEAISWHLQNLLEERGKIKNDENFRRVVFHEITPEAIKEAFFEPCEIDEDLVDAWKARRVLDRIVGYKLSPLLWAKIKRRLSAGRVQSVALRLICERRTEIEKFVPKEYWEIEALLKTPNPKLQTQKAEFVAKLVEKDGKKINLKTENEAKNTVNELEKAEYKVAKITAREVKKQPQPPFTTSTLTQVASSQFGYSAKRTMKLAQDLYERGLITYHRTDSVALANSAILAIRSYISKNFGQNFVPETPRKFRPRSKLAQEAHEAIRPTDILLKAGSLLLTDAAYRKIYDLIWKRAVTSQAKEAVFDQISVDILAAKYQIPNTKYLFRAVGSRIKFAGFLAISGKDEIENKEKVLPELSVDEILKLLKLISTQHFTEPPQAFTDGTLVKTLEAAGIGRPSTYASIISTLIERNYCERENKKLIPTELGKTVNSFLLQNFGQIVDIDFTAEMEANLDDIAQNRADWVSVIRGFFEPFEKNLEKVYKTAEKINLPLQDSGEICSKCGKKMVVRFSKFGKFLACSGFPTCKTTKSFTQDTGLTCPACGGNIVERHTRKGRRFWGCSNYPACNFASWTLPRVSKIDNQPE